MEKYSESNLYGATIDPTQDMKWHNLAQGLVADEEEEEA
jgi:hypothetical protein